MQKGIHWKQQERKLLRRKGTLMGEIQEKNVQINELPPEGSYVIVNQLHTYARGKGEDKIRTVYEPDKTFYDAWNFPRIFRIDHYTRGRENALDKKNDVVLICETPYGDSFQKRVKTYEVAIGILMLEVVDKNAKLYEGKSSKYRNWSDYVVVRKNNYGIKRETSDESVEGSSEQNGETSGDVSDASEFGDCIENIDDGLDMSDEEMVNASLGDDLDDIPEENADGVEVFDQSLDSYLDGEDIKRLWV